MKLLVNLIISIIFIVINIFLIAISQIPETINKNTLKSTFYELKIYDQVVKIAIDGWLNNKEFKNQNVFFKQLITKNANQIITSDWFSQNGDLIINKAFDTITKGKYFPNLQIDITEIKNNYLNLLKNSDVAEFIPNISKEIPDSISIENLINTDINDINYTLLQTKNYLNAIKITRIALIIINILIIITIIAINPRTQSLSLIGYSSIIIGLIYLIFPFVFSKFIVNKQGLEILTNNFTSIWNTLIIFILLFIIEKMSRWWSWIGLFFFSIGIISIAIKFRISRINPTKLK